MIERRSGSRARRALGLASALALGPGACAPVEAPIGPCPDVWQAAVVLDVRHARTGDPAAEGVTGFVTDGPYLDSLRLAPEGARLPGPQALLYAAWERPGTYDVHVHKAGFQSWSRTDVRVGSDGCTVGSRQMRVDLEPLP